jgi:CTP:phosphocholine cytidylyltransferase-like protein
MLSDLLPNKNLGVNAIRSIYASYWLPKLNKNQITRVAFLMRSSVSMIGTNYFKKSNDSQQITT